MTKKPNKTEQKQKLAGLIAVLCFMVLALALGVSMKFTIDAENKRAILEYTPESIPAIIEDDKGEITIEEVPTVESVDGGLFSDITDGVSVTDGTYADLGWSETYDVSSPEAFRNATIGRCIIANNYFGAQCVSLARVFWWSYADRDVSTCGTGMAKGMMDCAEQNAGDDFEIHWKEDYREIQAGDWLVFNGGRYGHVGMALGHVVNGYVALLGENQGGDACAGGGAATNIINISVKNLIGFYRPKAYIQPEPEPEPTPIAPDSGIVK